MNKDDLAENTGLAPDWSRRTFLASLGASLSGLVPSISRGVEPFKREGKPKLHLGLAAYSFRKYFSSVKGKPQKVADDKEISMADFIDYCADHEVGAELTSYFFPGETSDGYWQGIRRHAFLRGVPIVGTAVGNSFTSPKKEEWERQVADVKSWIDKAALFGAPHIRVFAGNLHGGSTMDEAKKICVEALEECADHAGKKGIFLGIENHGGIVAEADELIDIVKAVKSQWVGINLDTGNFRTADPYGDLAKCAPWAVNVQVKIEMKPKSKETEEADFLRLATILKDANYQGFVVLEYESADPWRDVPMYLDKLREAIAA